MIADLAEQNPSLPPKWLQKAGLAFFSALAVEQQDSQAWAATQKIGIARAKRALGRAQQQIKDLGYRARGRVPTGNW